MQSSNWVMLSRLVMREPWYTDLNAKAVFIHILLTVKFTEQYFKGIKLQPGQCVTTFKKLAEETGLTVTKIRVAIKKLEKAEILTRKITNKFTVITLVKYSVPGSQQTKNDTQNDNQMTHKNAKNNKPTYYAIMNSNNDNNVSSIGGDKISDDTWKAARYYEERFGMISSNKVRQLNDLIEDHGLDLVLFALRQANTGNANAVIPYVRTVCMNEARKREQRGTVAAQNENGEPVIDDPYLQSLYEESKRKGNVI